VHIGDIPEDPVTSCGRVDQMIAASPDGERIVDTRAMNPEGADLMLIESFK
jgi:hypothetical protein